MPQSVTIPVTVTIGEPTGAHSDDVPEASGALIKANDELRVATFVAYPVNKPDVAVAADGHIDFASKAVVELAAYNWLAKGGPLGLDHLRSTDDYETVASWLHMGPDWTIKAVDGSERTICDGDWLVTVRAKSMAAWEAIKSEAIGGASPQGPARRGDPSADVLASLRS